MMVMGTRVVVNDGLCTPKNGLLRVSDLPRAMAQYLNRSTPHWIFMNLAGLLKILVNSSGWLVKNPYEKI